MNEFTTPAKIILSFFRMTKSSRCVLKRIEISVMLSKSIVLPRFYQLFLSSMLMISYFTIYPLAMCHILF